MERGVACEADGVATLWSAASLAEAVVSSARSRVATHLYLALYNHGLIFDCFVSPDQTMRSKLHHYVISVGQTIGLITSVYSAHHASQAGNAPHGVAPLTPSASNRSRSSQARRLQAEPSYAHRIPLAPRVFPAALRAPGKNLRTSVRRTPVGPLE